jgi:hypothetical protein
MRLKRLQALEARLLRPAFKPFDYAAAAASLREMLALLTAGRICMVPQPATDPTPAMLAVYRQLDHIHERLRANQRQAAEEKRQAKLERRAKRRLEAASAPAAPPPSEQHGPPLQPAPPPAVAPPAPAEPDRSPACGIRLAAAAVGEA